MEAAKHEMQLGMFFSRLIREHSKNESKNSWDSILRGEALLSRRQSEEVKRHAMDFRKGLDFR